MTYLDPAAVLAIATDTLARARLAHSADIALHALYVARARNKRAQELARRDGALPEQIARAEQTAKDAVKADERAEAAVFAAGPAYVRYARDYRAPDPLECWLSVPGTAGFDRVIDAAVVKRAAEELLGKRRSTSDPAIPAHRSQPRPGLRAFVLDDQLCFSWRNGKGGLLLHTVPAGRLVHGDLSPARIAGLEG